MPADPTPDAAEREALLACPFCGGAAIACETYSGRETVGCQTDGCIGSCGVGERRLLCTRERWNRRAPEPAREAKHDLPEKQYSDGSRGKYQCKCAVCGAFFVGHKRDPACPKCAQPAPQQGGEVVGEIHATGYADGTRAVNSRGDIRALTLWLAQTEGGLPDEIQRCITERDQARGALLLLGYDGVISQSRARELLSMSIEDQRRWYREQFATPAPAAPVEVTDEMVIAALMAWHTGRPGIAYNVDNMRAALAAALAAAGKP